MRGSYSIVEWPRCRAGVVRNWQRFRLVVFAQHVRQPALTVPGSSSPHLVHTSSKVCRVPTQSHQTRRDIQSPWFRYRLEHPSVLSLFRTYTLDQSPLILRFHTQLVLRHTGNPSIDSPSKQTSSGHSHDREAFPRPLRRAGPRPKHVNTTLTRILKIGKP